MNTFNNDDERVKDTLIYLLYLTDPNLASSDIKSPPNESKIAEIWGGANMRSYVRRVLRSTFPEVYPDEKSPKVLPNLSLGKLVSILSSLHNYSKQNINNYRQKKDKLIITRNEILEALRLFTRISASEKGLLGLEEHPGEIILKELLKIATDPIKGLSLENINKLYQYFLRANYTTINSSLKGDNNDSKDDKYDEYINYLVDQYFENSSILSNMSIEKKSVLIKSHVKKVKREISRIEFQTGLKHLDLIGEDLTNTYYHETKQKYLSEKFVNRLTNVVIENNILNDYIPIYLKYYDIIKVKPLPLYVKRNSHDTGLLNPRLLEENEDHESINGLERQFVYKATVHFYIKIEDGYQTHISSTETNRTINNENRLEFFEEIYGIGSPISLIIAAINRVLFRDIPSLNEYFYVVKEDINTVELEGGGSSCVLWSHTLVDLCKNKEIENHIESQKDSTRDCVSNIPAYGEYCGFDQVEVVTKSALHARLRAIFQTGKKPSQYTKELCYRVEEENALKNGKELLTGYPFSLRAMEAFLDEKFLNKYRRRDYNYNFVLIKEKRWSMVAYEAHIIIAEAYLKEGLYRIAKRFLDLLDQQINKFTTNIMSDTMLAKYHSCWFRYVYLYDQEDDEYSSQYSDRSAALETAINHLRSAEKCLKSRVKKLNYISEIHHSNFNPFCSLKSRIYEYEAKIYKFFSSDIIKSRNKNNYLLYSIIKPLILFEKSRIYAAREGDSDIYACSSCYQSWCYLKLAYCVDKDLDEGNNYKILELTQTECIEWAKQLLEHAKLCYSALGKKYYQDIKNNSGNIYKSTNNKIDLEHQFYGSIQIKNLPLIQEGDSQSSYDGQVLKLDFSLFKDIVSSK